MENPLHKKGTRIEDVGRDGYGTILRSRDQSDIEDCELAKRSKEGKQVRPQAGAGFARVKSIRDGPYSVVIKITWTHKTQNYCLILYDDDIKNK